MRSTRNTPLAEKACWRRGGRKNNLLYSQENARAGLEPVKFDNSGNAFMMSQIFTFAEFTVQPVTEYPKNRVENINSRKPDSWSAEK